ncbi:MAG: hypothetical protein OK438_04380 [Thaumarchaeota archaeon]|nr:hypothetical protein [Nitrososphaerota archaeon]
MTDRILVYDNDGDASRKYKERMDSVRSVRENYQVDVLSTKEFKNQLDGLRERRKRLRVGKSVRFEGLEIDGASIFVVDYDLFQALSNEDVPTGEELCYLARCFSNCGLLVALNQFCKYEENVFDLSLRGHPESFADLNVGGRQIGNPGLWGEDSEFRPWSWPNLIRAQQSFEVKTKIMLEGLENPIAEVLGMEELAETMPVNLTKFLGLEGGKTLVRNFVAESASGLKGKDKPPSDEIVARIAASRVSIWLEGSVSPGQDILIDGPHLVSRFPSLLAGEPEDPASWNKTASFGDYDEIGIRDAKIKTFEFLNDELLSRPAWLWSPLSKSREIVEVEHPWERRATTLAFAEDTSKFHPRSECIEYEANLDSPYDTRFAKRVSGVDYRPANMLLR